MKCDELTPVTREYADEYWEDRFAMVYNADEIDAAIAELKRENERLNRQLEHVKNGDCINTCDVVEKHVKEELKAKRALWLARASEASKEVNYWTCQDESSYAIVDFNVRHETIVSSKAPHHRPYKWILIWENVERKCRAKAEEYK